MSINGFKRGSGCYNCVDCGRQTRNTGEQSMGSDLCPECWNVAGIFNALQDGYINEPEYEQAIFPYRLIVLEKGGVPNW